MRRSDQLGRLEQPRELGRTRLDGKKSITVSWEHASPIPCSPRSVDYRYCSSRLPFLLHPHNWNISVQTCVPRSSFVCLLLWPFIFIPIASCPVKVTYKMAMQCHCPLSWRKPGTRRHHVGKRGCVDHLWRSFGSRRCRNPNFLRWAGRATKKCNLGLSYVMSRRVRLPVR